MAFCNLPSVFTSMVVHQKDLVACDLRRLILKLDIFCLELYLWNRDKAEEEPLT